MAWSAICSSELRIGSMDLVTRLSLDRLPDQLPGWLTAPINSRPKDTQRA